MPNKPEEISLSEWKEIMQLPAVTSGWGLEFNGTPSTADLEEFVSRVYAVKFDFVSGGPGYVGDLYVVLGDSLGPPPLLLIRGRDGRLREAH